MLSRKLLEILCCPKCKVDVTYAPDGATLTCSRCGRVYPVTQDIPILLVEDHESRG